jgi:hypothetical protein
MTRLVHRQSNKWTSPGRWLAAPVCLLLAWLLCGSSGFALVVTRTSSPIFYIDTSITPPLQGMYVSYQISNNDGTSYGDLWVGIDSFSGGVISLAPSEDGLMHLGPLAPGQTKTAFFFLQASGETALAQTHAIRVYPTRPPTAALATANFSMTSMETIQANANKVVTVVTGPSPPQLGGIVTMTVTGDAGTIGADRIMSFNPAAYLNWRADAFELISSSITLSGGNAGTYNDQLMNDCCGFVHRHGIRRCLSVPRCQHDDGAHNHQSNFLHQQRLADQTYHHGQLRQHPADVADGQPSDYRQAEQYHECHQ